MSCREFSQRYVVLNEKVMSTETLFENEEQALTICDKFVGEQLRRLERGEEREDAAKAAFWDLRHSGVDIRMKAVSKSMFHLMIVVTWPTYSSSIELSACPNDVYSLLLACTHYGKQGAKQSKLELLGVPSDKAEQSTTVNTLEDLLATLDHTRD